MLAGTGPDVYQVIGAHHHFLVVLHHDHAVAAIAQAAQALDQPLIVALVQADAGFVQDVEHAGELAADLRGEAYALCFAAGKGARAAIEREVFQPYIEQELRSYNDLFHRFLRDHRLLFIQFSDQAGHEGVEFSKAQTGEFVDVLFAKAEEQRGLLQPASVAFRAGHHVRETARPFLCRIRSFLGLFQNERDDPFELHVAIAEADVARHAQRLLHAVEDRSEHVVLHLRDRRGKVVAEVLQHRFDLLEDPTVLVRSQRNDRTFLHAFRSIGNDLVQRHIGDLAQSAAARACAVG